MSELGNDSGHPTEALRLPKTRLDDLIQLLWDDGYRVLGPILREGSVAFDDVHRSADLPVGWRDEQQPGRYRLVPGVPGEVFGVVNGPGSLKAFFFAPEETLLEIHREKKGFRVQDVLPAPARLAIIGVRACDLAALAVQDRIFLHDRIRDAHYAVRRADVLLVAVSCTRSVSTCFCVSMGTGPEATRGYDIALTELEEVLVARGASAAGQGVLERLVLGPSSAEEQAAAGAAIERCAQQMERRLDTSDLPALLYDEVESPRWKEVAERCLSCTNCTMVCPTCFCHAVVDETVLNGNMSQRVRRWDSCFSYEHAHVHGKNYRPHIRDRYRQWLTHKLASWIDQFGTSGCVGCGRCITWCPVGIDLTEEVAAIRAAAST